MLQNKIFEKTSLSSAKTWFWVHMQKRDLAFEAIEFSDNNTVCDELGEKAAKVFELWWAILQFRGCEIGGQTWIEEWKEIAKLLPFKKEFFKRASSIY